MANFGIGQAVPRTEDPRLLTGSGRHTDDVALPGRTVADFLRSPLAHAAIGAMDVSAARGAPGVGGVVTADDLEADGIGTLPVLATVESRGG